MGEITTANALLEVTNVRNSVGNGTTKPHYGVIDEKLCVIKGINNPEKHLVLFNEYFGYSLAKILGLNTPDFGFALISHKTLFDDERKKKYFIPGCLCFFTTYIEKTVLLRGVKQLSGAEESDLLGILLFDLLICNIDRNPGNLLLRKPKNQNLTMYPIDYTHAFELQAIWDQGQLSRYVKEPREEIDLERIHTQRIHQDIKEAKTFRAENIEGCISYFKKVLAQTDLSKIVNEMPAPLLDKISDEDIELFIQFIARRIEDLEHIEEYAKQVFCRR